MSSLSAKKLQNDSLNYGSFLFTDGSSLYVEGWSSFSHPRQSIWKYTISSNTWEYLNNVPFDTAMNSMYSTEIISTSNIDGKGYVYCRKVVYSSNSSTVTYEFWEYDPSHNLWTMKALPPVNGIWSSCSDGKKIFMLISEQKDTTQQNFKQSLLSYSPTSNVWQNLDESAPVYGIITTDGSAVYLLAYDYNYVTGIHDPSFDGYFWKFIL